MSLYLNSDNDYVTRTGAANLGNTDEFTFAVWYGRNETATGTEVVASGIPGIGFGLLLPTTTQIRGYVSGASNGDAAFANLSWGGLAIRRSYSASSWTTSLFQSGILTNVYSFSSGDTGNCSFVALGQTGGYYTTARGYYRYARFWTVRKSDAELEGEFNMTPSAGTPAASLTGLYFSWPLANGTDTTDWSGNSRAPTISGAGTSSEEPPLGGSSVFIPTQYRRINSLLRM